jgi:hypothetical protein
MTGATAVVPPPAETSLAEWLTAGGTIGATFLALAGIYRAWWNRPRLMVDTDRGPAPNDDQDDNTTRFEGYGETAAGNTYSPGDTFPSSWVRARVACRKGRADAAEVVVLRASMLADGETRPVRVDGRALWWSGYNPKQTRLDLSPGLPRRVDVACVTKSRQGPRTPLELQVDFESNNKASHVERGRVTLTLAAVSSNGPASFYSLVLDYDGQWPDDEPVWGHLKVVSLRRLRPRRALRRG